MARILPLAALAFISLSAGLAQAAPKDYCEAYARDFADRGPKDETVWKSHRDGAFNDCLLQFGNGAVAAESAPPVAKPAKKPAKAATAKVRRKAEPAPEQDIAEPLPEPAVIVAPDIEPPAKSFQPAAKPTVVSKSKSLLGKLFKPKDGAGSNDAGQNAQTAQASPTSLKGRLVPGSSAWLDYCERKYASFNRGTGTYKSFKGVERKCLVTD